MEAATTTPAAVTTAEAAWELILRDITEVKAIPSAAIPEAMATADVRT